MISLQFLCAIALGTGVTTRLCGDEAGLVENSTGFCTGDVHVEVDDASALLQLTVTGAISPLSQELPKLKQAVPSNVSRTKTWQWTASHNDLHRFRPRLLETMHGTMLSAGKHSSSAAAAVFIAIMWLFCLAVACRCMLITTQQRFSEVAEEDRKSKAVSRSSSSISGSLGGRHFSRQTSAMPSMPSKPPTSNEITSPAAFTFRPDYNAGGLSSLLSPSSLDLDADVLPLYRLTRRDQQFVCVIQNDLKNAKQNITFDVGSHSGAPVFRVNVSELGRSNPGITIRNLDGTLKLAWLSTEELWKGSDKASTGWMGIYRMDGQLFASEATASDPALHIYRGNGEFYGTVKKVPHGDYQVQRGENCLLTLSGDFTNHNIQIRSADGRTVGSTSQLSAYEYQVTMQSRSDAVLVVMTLLAIDKITNAIQRL